MAIISRYHVIINHDIVAEYDTLYKAQRHYNQEKHATLTNDIYELVRCYDASLCLIDRVILAKK